MSVGNLGVSGNSTVSAAGGETFQLGGWQIAPRLNEVQHGGETVRLEPRMMQTLVVLARNAGMAVTRDQLMADVWGHNHITDDTLNRNVAFGLPNEQIDEAAVWRAIRAAQLEEFVGSLQEGLDTLVGERGVRRS